MTDTGKIAGFEQLWPDRRPVQHKESQQNQHNENHTETTSHVSFASPACRPPWKLRLQEARGHDLDHLEFLELALGDELNVRGQSRSSAA